MLFSPYRSSLSCHDDVLLRLRQAKKTAYYELVKKSGSFIRPVSALNALIPLFNTILQLDGHILSWHENLPEYLKFPISHPSSGKVDSPNWLQL